LGPWTRDLPDLELDCRPTPSGIFDDVLLGGAGPTADQSDLAGQEGQRAFAITVEQPLGREDALQVLEPGEELADPDRADLSGIEVQGAAFGPEGRLGLDDDACALGQGDRHGVQRGGADGDVERHVDVHIPQRQVGGGLSRTAADLDHLPFDPQSRHLVDVVRDLETEQAYRPGPFRRRVRGTVGERLGTAHGSHCRCAHRLMFTL